MSRRALLAAAAAVVAAALLAIGGVIAGLSGSADVGCALAVVGLLAIRARVGLAEPARLVRDDKRRDGKRRPAVRAADFPGFGAIAADVSWGSVSRRHYEHGLRRRLARLAAGQGAAREAREALEALDAPAGPLPGGQERPGPDQAAIERLIRRLEEP